MISAFVTSIHDYWNLVNDENLKTVGISLVIFNTVYQSTSIRGC